MEIWIAVIVAVAIGVVVGILWERSKSTPLLSKTLAERDASTKESERLAGELERQRREQEIKLSELQVDMDRRSKERVEAMKNDFKLLARQVLEAETLKLKENGTEQFQSVVTPLKERIEHLGKAIQEVNEKGASNKTSFDEAMRRLAEQTASIGVQAENLTRALKGEAKTQGDWGEMILDSILEHSGLRKGVEYATQSTVRTTEGKDFRPDVIVNFPDTRCVVIDSKVSLMAYMKYLNAADASEQGLAVKEHVASVKKHIDELAAKDYTATVNHTDNYVLMFMQSDAAYILAVKSNPNLNEYAFSKRVIITCPTTLMMTLQIIYNIWQSDRQNRNVETIVTKASALYDKFVGFTASMTEIDKGLRKATDAYAKSISQLESGRGNIVRQLEDLKEMGINPKKDIPEDIKARAGVELPA